MITVEKVTKEFRLDKKQRKQLKTDAKTVKAVDEISFSCESGRIFTLLGPNGAGKTTTLRMIATILKPSAGKISVKGIDVEKQSQDVRRQIGFLTGSTGLYHRLTPNEIVDYFGKIYKVPSQTLKERKEELFELLGIHEFSKKKIDQLSTGMKQKVSIARTMIHDPDVVIFDEPTSGLDVITAEHIIELIINCKAAGKTVIFSSHIMSRVELLCDDLAIIHQGKLIFYDTMEVFRSEMQAQNLTQEFIRRVNSVDS